MCILFCVFSKRFFYLLFFDLKNYSKNQNKSKLIILLVDFY